MPLWLRAAPTGPAQSLPACICTGASEHKHEMDSLKKDNKLLKAEVSSLTARLDEAAKMAKMEVKLAAAQATASMQGTLMETYEKGMARAISMQIATQQRFAGPSTQSPANEGGMFG